MKRIDPTPYADINQLLEQLLLGIQEILGEKLMGIYLYGSLVIGDFDTNISDIDLVAALSSDIIDKEFEELQKMHKDFVKKYKDEFIQSVKAQVKAWGEWIDDIHTRKQQAYAILTMCRALYAYKNGRQVSKKQAVLWAQKEFPEWSSFIQNTLLWREDWRNEQIDHEETFPNALRFVRFAISQCENGSDVSKLDSLP